MKTPESITIRVYGLLLKQNKVLLSRENVFGEILTKFPGGGLELGEGVIDCLKREFMEEVEIELSDWNLFHINEGYMASAFHEAKQVLSIYYLCKSRDNDLIKSGDPTDDQLLQNHNDQILYWCDFGHLNDQDIRLPIDREVVLKLIQDKDAQGF